MGKTSRKKTASETLKTATLVLSKFDLEINNETIAKQAKAALKKSSVSLNELQAIRIEAFKPYDEANKLVKLYIDDVLDKKKKGSPAHVVYNRLLEYEKRKKDQAEALAKRSEEIRSENQNTIPQIAADLAVRIGDLKKGVAEGKSEYVDMLNSITFKSAIKSIGIKHEDAEPLGEAFDQVISCIRKAHQDCKGNPHAFQSFCLQCDVDLIEEAQKIALANKVSKEVKAATIIQESPTHSVKQKTVLTLNTGNPKEDSAEALATVVLQMAIDGRLIKNGRVSPWVRSILDEYSRTNDDERISYAAFNEEVHEKI